MKKIGLLPFIDKKKNLIVHSVDNNLIRFLKYCFSGCKIEILYGQKSDYDILIIPGSNSLIKFDKRKITKQRNNLDLYYFNDAIKKNKSIIGICYGAQFIADYFHSKIIKIKNHVKKKHKILFNNFSAKKKFNYLVNSYHDYAISHPGNSLEVIARSCKDNTIECFKVKKRNIVGIMWHPERNKKFYFFDKNLLNKFI
jgi:putative glutamine amidotransferase